jgi:predicted anti-sigma-YlaC factor YlaD
MDCNTFNNLLPDIFDNCLNSEISVQIEEHMFDCQDCRISYAKTLETINELKSVIKSTDVEINIDSKNKLRKDLLENIRIQRALSPFLSGLFNKQKEIDKKITILKKSS